MSIIPHRSPVITQDCNLFKLPAEVLKNVLYFVLEVSIVNLKKY
jgi:hypothetical protein